MREINDIELHEIEGGIAPIIIGAVAAYICALGVVQQMGASSGAANARRNAE